MKKLREIKSHFSEKEIKEIDKIAEKQGGRTRRSIQRQAVLEFIERNK